MEIKVGQKVFLKPVGNASRYGNRELREEVILKVGRKYFFVGKEGQTNEKRMTKFYIEDLREVSDYSANWSFYFSKQEILDEEESYKLVDAIRTKFGHWGKVDLSLEQLRKIHEIIKSQDK